jgi:protocatechuate 3,4-dioxygenase beta subunit
MERTTMRAKMEALVVTAALLACCLLSAQGLPQAGQANPGAARAAGDEKAPKPPSGIIRGRITSAETGAPLPRALVVLSQERGESRATSADADGRYQFKDLAVGRYALTAGKTRYVTLQYGQRSAAEAGKPIDLADGQVLDKIDIVLAKGGVIAGHVLDELGEPADDVRIAAMRVQYVDGRPQLVQVGPYVRTDDLGEYRLSGLLPGSYYVGTPAPVADSVPRPGPGRAFVQSLYPGTSNLSEAAPVLLDVGQERLDVDFGLVVGRPARITGIVVDRQGRRAVRASVLAMQAMGRGGFFIPARASTQPDGTFTIENLAPGEYTLSADSTDRATGADESATLRITVTGEDVEKVVMMTLPLVRMTGRIRTEPQGDRTFSPKEIRIYAERSDQSPVSMGGRTTVRSDWTFEVTDLAAGPARFTVTGLPTGWTLKAITYGGSDVTDTPINLREDLGGVEIVVTNRITELNGGVTDADNRAVTEYTLVVYAEDSSRWDRSRFVATARPDQNGRFSVRGLPPGKYLAVAVDRVAGGDPNDPEYLERMRSRATKVTLGDALPQWVDLKVAKADSSPGS